MRHPVNAAGNKRICPCTRTQFEQAWTDHDLPGCYNKCEQCYPGEYISVSQRLAALIKGDKL